MKHLHILIGFFPWILFGILAGHTLLSLEIAISLALIGSVVFIYNDLRKGFIFAWLTLCFFLFAFLSIVVFHNVWIARHIGILTNGALALLAWGTIIINKPFTEQYAKEDVEPAIWGKPSFKNKNRLISGVWGVLFLINMLFSIFLPHEGHVFQLLSMFFTIFIGLVVTVVIIEKYKVT